MSAGFRGADPGGRHGPGRSGLRRHAARTGAGLRARPGGLPLLRCGGVVPLGAALRPGDGTRNGSLLRTSPGDAHAGARGGRPTRGHARGAHRSNRISRQPIPHGELRFSVSGLRADPAATSPQLWYGAVCGSGQADFPVWAKVRIAISGTRVTAAEALAPGHPIARAQLRQEPYEGPPGLPDLSQIVDRVPRRPIPAGTVIERQWLDAPVDVVRGERVRMEIRSGRARVILEGQAQSSGRRGEIVGVRNPANGKILHATVADRGRVVLTADQGETVPLESEHR